jgi:hypothetical protein
LLDPAGYAHASHASFSVIFKCLLEYKMFEENLALLRTHHKNVQRYRQLLGTSLTDFEREYIGKRLLEEQLAIETLSANAPSEATSSGPWAANVEAASSPTG